MEQNINVFCRARPNNTSTDETEQSDACFNISPDSSEITISTQKRIDMELTFKYDHVFRGEATQADVFAMSMLPVVNDVIAGFNATVFAYGQTGSGKTYTIIGSPRKDCEEDERLGLMPRASGYLFKTLHELQKQDQRKFELQCAFVEVYQEKIKDLLVKGKANQNLEIKHHRRGSVYIKDLTYQKVESVADMMRLMHISRARRVTCATFMNDYSSRSHWLAMIRVTQTFPDSTVQRSKLNFVDLAGSEKVSKSGVTGHSLDEAKLINKSLLMLGQVINALATKAPHIPYRDSKLTHILKDSLGGNTKTTLLVTISPLASCQNETISTLRFGSRAQQIVTRANINRRMSRQQLQDVIKKLEKQLSCIQSQSNGSSLSHSPSPSPGLSAEIKELRALVQKLEESIQTKEDELGTLRREKDDLTDKVAQSEVVFGEICARNRALVKSKEELQNNVAALSERVNLHQEHMKQVLDARSSQDELQDGLETFQNMQDKTHSLFRDDWLSLRHYITQTTSKCERGLQQILFQQQEFFTSIITYQQSLVSQLSLQNTLLQTIHAPTQSNGNAIQQILPILEQSRAATDSPTHRDEEKEEFLNIAGDTTPSTITPHSELILGRPRSLSLQEASRVLVGSPEQTHSEPIRVICDESEVREASGCNESMGSFNSSECHSDGTASPANELESSIGQTESSVTSESVVVYGCDGLVFSAKTVCEDYFEKPDVDNFGRDGMRRSFQTPQKRRKKFRWVLFARRKPVPLPLLPSQSPKFGRKTRKQAVDLTWDSHKVAPYQLFLNRAPH